MNKPREIAGSAQQGTASATPTRLDERESNPQPDDFNPVEIIGEPLSVTIIRERR